MNPGQAIIAQYLLEQLPVGNIVFRHIGTKTRIFDGDAPKGLLLLDRAGHYSLQLYRADRPRFANPDKARASAQEYRAAVMGASTHYGTLAVDPGRHQLVFHIEGASFPNWEGQQQRRAFELRGDTLSYRVPPRPDGNRALIGLAAHRRLRQLREGAAIPRKKTSADVDLRNSPSSFQ